VLVTSGYSELATREHFGDSDRISFIQKPYTVQQLTEKITALAPGK
jgi:hypothetical protein